MRTDLPINSTLTSDPTQLRAEIVELRLQLDEAEDILRAIRSGAVDALVVAQGSESHIYTLEGADRPYRTLVERISQGAIVLDAAGLVTYANPSFGVLIGCPSEQLLGLPLDSWLDPAHLPRYQKLLAQHQIPSRRDEFELIRHDGSRVPVYLTFDAMDDPSVVQSAVLVTDLTARKEQEARDSAATALILSEKQFRALAETMPQIVWASKPDGVLDYVNRRFIESSGQTEEQLYRRNGWEPLIYPADLPETHRRWDEATRTGNDYQIEYRLRDASGDWRWHLGRAVAIRGASGKIERWYGTCTDIHVQKVAVEQQLAQSKRLHQLADAALTINAAHTIEEVVSVVLHQAIVLMPARRAHVHLRGADGESWDGSYSLGSDSIIERGEDGPTPIEIATKICLSGRAGRDDGHWLGAPFVGRAGRNLGLVYVTEPTESDFTGDDEGILAQLAHVAAVAIANAHLYDELVDRDRRKDEFLATLAHELRNPLAPVRNALQVMSYQSGNDDETFHHARAMMERQIAHMVRLVDDLLDVSRITRGKAEFTSCACRTCRSRGQRC